MGRGTRTIRIEPPYSEDLEGILVFRSFAEAEISLCRLENLRVRYARTGDRKGVEWCRHVGRTGRRRAEMISRNSRVDPAKRRRYAEIADWFRVWLETPEIFGDWLALRKESETYRKLTGAEHCDGE